MLAKMTSKNQLTIPKKIIDSIGIGETKNKYFDISVHKNKLIMTPVSLAIEEDISKEQWESFKKWAKKNQAGDKSFESTLKADQFLSKRLKKK